MSLKQRKWLWGVPEQGWVTSRSRHLGSKGLATWKFWGCGMRRISRSRGTLSRLSLNVTKVYMRSGHSWPKGSVIPICGMSPRQPLCQGSHMRALPGGEAILSKRLSLTAWYWKTVTNASIYILTLFSFLYVVMFTAFRCVIGSSNKRITYLLTYFRTGTLYREIDERADIWPGRHLNLRQKNWCLMIVLQYINTEWRTLYFDHCQWLLMSWHMLSRHRFLSDCLSL